MNRLLLAALACALACGGGRVAPERGGGVGGGSALAMEQSPSERECDELIAHAVELGMNERAAKQSDASGPTADDQRALTADLRARFGPGCRALPRPRYACAMAATTLEVLDACER